MVFFSRRIYLQNKDECELIINVLYSLMIVYFKKNPPGCSLENINLNLRTTFNKVCYIFFDSIFPYLLIKKKDSFFFQKVEKIYKFLNLLVFLNFLRKGRAISLVDYTSRVEYSKINPNHKRFIDNEFLNKNIIWKYIFSFAITLLPFLTNTIFPSLIKKLYIYSSYLG